MTDIDRRGDVVELMPFLKWAGGKRWLYRTYSDHFPVSFDRYYEPFIGGAAIFLALKPKNGQISDINEELISTYKAIKQDWHAVSRGLHKHQKLHSNDYYYRVRMTEPDGLYARAARFLYLNRTCWNGLYRVNLKGVFNVPRGTKNAVTLSTDNFEEVSRRLSGITLKVADFEVALRGVKRNDFVYIDPPYTVKHNVNGFLKYNETIFSWSDQERLASCVERLAKIGAKALVSQANHQSIRMLYRNIGTHHVVTRSSVIAATSDKRGLVTELIIRINY